MSSITLKSYKERAAAHPIAVARDLLACMDRKQTNLCVSVDVTNKKNLLRIVDAAGPYCCCVKTHIDIVSDFDEDLIVQLQALAEKHDFLIWEDRKFADIGDRDLLFLSLSLLQRDPTSSSQINKLINPPTGNTVKLQYSSGVYKIASWAHLTNAHPIPGSAIVTGLKSVGLPLNRGLLLLAEMSSKGNLATGDYTAATVAMAREHDDFVAGFVAQRRVDEDVDSAGGVAVGSGADFVIVTPGVGLDSTGDGMGQQYRSPDEVIRKCGCDVQIVGRGIYGGGDGDADDKIVQQAKRYMDAGWKAYLQRIGSA
ncbi:Orotidine 5'-phosphate decarboxylase [Meredithblackwellia eburnea MCA 4105]